jgi:hypothetical protein
MEKRYALIDSSNLVVDITIWDGNTETWKPDINTEPQVGLGMTYNNSGTGVGVTTDNKWIIPKEDEFDGANWDINGNGSDDMYA